MPRACHGARIVVNFETTSTTNRKIGLARIEELYSRFENATMKYKLYYNFCLSQFASVRSSIRLFPHAMLFILKYTVQL